MFLVELYHANSGLDDKHMDYLFLFYYLDDKQMDT